MNNRNFFTYVVNSGSIAINGGTTNPTLQMASDSKFIPRRIIATGNAGVTLLIQYNNTENLSNVPFNTSLFNNTSNAGVPILDLNVWDENAQLKFNFTNTNTGGNALNEQIIIVGEKIPVQPNA